MKNLNSPVMDIMDKVDTYKFIQFLQWLDEEHNWSARSIIDIVEKPFKYQLKWEEFLNERS